MDTEIVSSPDVFRLNEYKKDPYFDYYLEVNMPFWQRLLITVVVMLLVSFVAGAIWRSIFIVGIPSYLAGIIGGVTALPVWEFLKRRKSKSKK